ncbi:hypothetical protein ACFVYG_01115 [Streptomyces sp. NPDC058256]
MTTPQPATVTPTHRTESSSARVLGAAVVTTLVHTQTICQARPTER